MSRFDAVRALVWHTEQLAKALDIPISKALDPLDPEDFITISVRLARALRGAAVGLEGDALKTAIESLDVDWTTISEERRDAIISAARREVAGLAETVPPLVEPVLFRAASTIVPASRTAAISRFDISAAEAIGGWVEGIIGDLRDSQMVYVKDQYSMRADRFDQLARDTVADGLEKGLGRDDISEALARTLTPLGVERGKTYWNLIATDYSNKARTSSQLNTFQDAGIKRWQFEAVLDEATSEICRLLHGRTFSVKVAAKKMNDAIKLRDPEDVRDSLPWVQASENSLYFTRGSSRRNVATVHEWGEGESDRIGSYGDVMSNSALEKAGVVVPPRHGHCRSTILAVV